MNIFKFIPSIDPFTGMMLVFFAVIILLVVYLTQKMKQISYLKTQLEHSSRVLEDLDHQAKLIIKSDMEAKLYQQEIEEELNKLTLIKNMITSSMYILDREKLFLEIDQKLINQLGFETGLVLSFDTLEAKANIGFSTQKLAAVRNILQYKKQALKEVQLLPPDTELYVQLEKELQVNDLIVTSIKTSEYMYAILFVANHCTPTEIKKPEIEAILIICMYLSRCLDNIRLFEDYYHVRDDLEKKIKERTNELVKSLREIEKISKMKSDFISSVSHELRTPLTSVKGFSSLLVGERFGKLPEDAKERLIKIDENVNKLMDIVNTLLDIARIESRKVEVKIAPLDLGKLVKDTGDFLMPQIEAKKIHFKQEIPEQLMVFADKTLLERVFINLLGNALKFTPVEGVIKVGCERRKNEVVVSVCDSGCGMSQEDLGKLFQEFFRASNTINSQVKGTGLGLSLVKRIIDTHKEKIWVESEPNKGTTFFFTLRGAEHG